MSNLSPWGDLSRPPLRQTPLRRAVLDGRGPWTSLDVLPETGSTNAVLRERAASGQAAHGAVLVTDHQTAGRGRRDRVWTAPPRSALAVSVLVVPDDVGQQRWSWLSLLVGLGVADALARVAGVRAELKWPNDVQVPLDGVATRGAPRGKVCGVLAEVVATPAGGAVVLGLGLNVSQRRDELPADTATSLAAVGAATTDRDTLLRAVLRAVGGRYQAWQDAGGDPRASGLAAAYREACSTIGCQVQVQLPGDQQLAGRADGVDDDGRLLVSPDDGGPLQSLAAGDVVHLRPGTQVDEADRSDGMI